ncbi:MAG: (d)CMP kinase, partial [Muribaculaceae bacterium]|nr:(d)CMP kinase [Muribaculaceae bacterium]
MNKSIDNKIVIAIDGYSSSGKSTMAKALASRIGYRYVDSGAMYRAVTLYGMNNGLIVNGQVDTEALITALPAISIDFEVKGNGQHTILNGDDVENEIRTLAVSGNVSKVAVIPEVRHFLVKLQQDYGKQGGIVMD